MRYFVAVADELSVARAAERLYASQPAVSKQLRALERRLGFALFERRPDGLVLTPEGVALRERARSVLEDWQEAVDTARGAGHRTFVIGLQTAIDRGLTRSMHACLAGYEWSVALRMMPWSDCSAGLRTGTSDAAVLWHPVDPGLPSRVLSTEPRCVALPEDDPLARSTAVTFEEIAMRPFIALPESSGRCATSGWLMPIDPARPRRSPPKPPLPTTCSLWSPKEWAARWWRRATPPRARPQASGSFPWWTWHRPSSGSPGGATIPARPWRPSCTGSLAGTRTTRTPNRHRHPDLPGPPGTAGRP